jgi:hypothetical protein
MERGAKKLRLADNVKRSGIASCRIEDTWRALAAEVAGLIPKAVKLQIDRNEDASIDHRTLNALGEGKPFLCELPFRRMFFERTVEVKGRQYLIGALAHQVSRDNCELPAEDIGDWQKVIIFNSLVLGWRSRRALLVPELMAVGLDAEGRYQGWRSWGADEATHIWGMYPMAEAVRAIAWLNAGNVELIDEPLPLHKRRGKAIRMAHPGPGLRYKILRVRRSKGQRNERPERPDYFERPYHQVMGHLKVYTREKPLFGKHPGQWLWSDYWRGDMGAGMIIKDYEEPPQ